MVTVREFTEKYKFDCPSAFDEPMATHTTFGIGGPADLFLRPRNEAQTGGIIDAARREVLPVYILGGGANILVGDRGIRGIVLDLSSLDRVDVCGNGLQAGSGTRIDPLCEAAARAGLSGLEFIYGMPGTVGGALYMNARCYEKSICETLADATVLTKSGETAAVPFDPSEWGYKKSPFQGEGMTILSARFTLVPGEKGKIIAEMESRKADRTAKGHYRFPCAGSIFKNNRDFGVPTGKILDDLGLRGYAIGGAKVSDFHANIFVNSGGATARDMKSLIEYAQKKAHDTYGFELEPEVLFIGEF